MRKIFVDIGGYDGRSAEFFLNTHPQAKDFEVYVFECDPRHIATIRRKELPVRLIDEAAWVYNGKVRFYPAQAGTRAGGTMYRGKTTGHVDRNKFIEVGCIDIAEFISWFKDAYIIVKINAEGAEYNIIPHIINKGIKVDKWYVQWHWDKIGISEDEHKRIASMIEWHPWKAQMKPKDFEKEFLKTL